MEWPDFAKGFEPRGLDLRVRGYVCVEVVWSCVAFRTFCGVCGKDTRSILLGHHVCNDHAPARRRR